MGLNCAGVKLAVCRENSHGRTSGVAICCIFKVIFMHGVIRGARSVREAALNCNARRLSKRVATVCACNGNALADHPLAIIPWGRIRPPFRQQRQGMAPPHQTLSKRGGRCRVAEMDSIIEEAIRNELKKPEGKLTKTYLEKVTRLILNGTKKVTDAGLKGVAKLKQLKGLYLEGTEITDAALKEVAKLKQLNFLALNLTQITDAGLKEVAKLKRLRFVNLEDTKVTPAGMAQLQKALPKCRITHYATR